MSLNLIYLSLGSNLGDKEDNLRQAVERISAVPGVRILKRSSLYRTDPVGYTEQDWFLNAVLKVESDLSPLDFLDRTQAIEKDLGRQRLIHWGPRTIDIDMLLFNGEVIDHPRLRVPHPEMTKRLFVLVPLHEVDPDVPIPQAGAVKDVLKDCGCTDSILLVKDSDRW